MFSPYPIGVFTRPNGARLPDFDSHNSRIAELAIFRLIFFPNLVDSYRSGGNPSIIFYHKVRATRFTLGNALLGLFEGLHPQEGFIMTVKFIINHDIIAARTVH